MDPTHESARRMLTDDAGAPTPRYAAYLAYRAAYQGKAQAWRDAYAAAAADPLKLQAWPVVGRSYHDEADRAMARWEALGFKQEIEAALASAPESRAEPPPPGS